jgi:hypothetical protein
VPDDSTALTEHRLQRSFVERFSLLAFRVGKVIHQYVRTSSQERRKSLLAYLPVRRIRTKKRIAEAIDRSRTLSWRRGGIRLEDWSLSYTDRGLNLRVIHCATNASKLMLNFKNVSWESNPESHDPSLLRGLSINVSIGGINEGGAKMTMDSNKLKKQLKRALLAL